MVLQHAAERGAAADVTRQPDGDRVKIAGERDWVPLVSREDRLDGQIIAKGFPTSLVDVADGRADLRIGIRVDILLQKIDETPIALE